MAHRCAGALLTPSLVTQVEDEDVEREEEEDAGDGEGSVVERSNCGVEALVDDIIEFEG